uniref:SSD domain-containing protein n=1 Tax=Peronospora matthiolae TaxID=2874970 RepID=A0AAV1UFD3_9STRA
MWLFAAISVTIATPCVRSWLEALFAELSIVFFTYLKLVSIALTLVLLLALGFHTHRFLYRRRSLAPETCTTSLSNAVAAKNKALGHVQWRRGTKRHALLLRVKSTTSEIAGSGFYPPQLWTLALVVLTMLPIINSVMVGGGRGERGEEGRTASNFHGSFKHETATAVAADAVAAAALVVLQQQLTTCRSSEGDTCLDNVTKIAELGEYRQAAGCCVAFDAAYVDGAQTETTMLAQYFPIDVQEAYKHGYDNNFSAWSDINQEAFRTDCSLLYNETVKGEAQELLCCTETQYEMLSSRLRQLPGQCASCKENVHNLWCQFTCHPSNSLFVDVTQVRLLEGDVDHAHEVFPVIEEATYYVGRDVVSDLHDFCEADAEFAPLVCGTNKENCSTTGLDMLKYLSAYSFHSVGSSSQVHFTTMEHLTVAEQEQTICTCGNTNTTGCFAPMNTRLESCADTCGSLCAVAVDGRRQYESVCYNSSSSLVLDDLSVPTYNSTLAASDSSTTSQIGSLLSELSSRVEDGDVIVLNYVLAVLASFWLTALALGFAYSARYSKKKRESVLTDPVNGSRGRGMLLPLTDVDRLEGISRWDDWLTQHLKRWGDFVAMGNHPLYIVLLSLMVVVCCSSGLARLEVESESMKLWVSEGSAVFQERARFEKMLGPLDRVERLVLVTKDGGAVTRSAYLKEAIRLQLIIANEVTSGNSTLSDICLKDALTSSCQVHAVTQYFQNNVEHFEVYETYGLVDKHLSNCANSPERADSDVCSELQAQINASSGTSLPASMNDCPCLSSFGAPMLELEKYLGGITAMGDSLDANTLLQQGSTLLSTVAVVNHQDTAKNIDAIAWERAFLTRMKKEADANELYDVYYAAETSAEDEFANALDLDVVCKAGFAGFVFTFVYVVVGLNHWKLDRSFFYSSKIGVGVMGVACILMSIGGTLGLIAWTGAKLQVVTLVTLPSVVLAISTGNIFLILHAVDLKQDELKMEQQSLFVGLEDNDFGVHEITCVLLCEATGHIGPSIIVTTVCECCILAVAAYSAMPAAQWLAGSLVVGIAVSLALQMTLFLAIVALDKRRELSGTYDVICCKRASFARRSHLSDGTTATTENSSFSGSSFSLPTWNLTDRCVMGYLKILTTKTMESGLVPTSFIPSSSYLHAYYRALDESSLSRKEFPVYFVVEAGYGSNPDGYSLVNDRETQRKLCTSREVCANLSIPNILSNLVKEGVSNVTSFKNGPAVGSWLDDFWGFIDPDSECCRIELENDYAYSPLRPEESTAEYVRERVTSTSSCLADASEVVSVPRESFIPLVRMFYTTASGPLCSYAAGPRYRGQLSIDRRAIPAMNGNTTLTLNGSGYGNDVTAFAYKVMSTAARLVHSEQTDIDIWVYSPEYVFLDQFHSVRHVAYILLSVGLAVIFVLQSAALGSCGYGLAVTFIAAATAVQVAGLMTSMGMFLNPLSIVNFAIAVAFSVGFSGHFARLFAKARSLTDTFGYPLAGDVCVEKVMMQLLTPWTLGVAMSKFVAIAALALVATPAGNCFFRASVAAAVCAWLNNALLLPVVLSILVDATEGRVREVKSTTEEGDEYSCSSPSSSYHDVSVVGFY